MGIISNLLQGAKNLITSQKTTVTLATSLIPGGAVVKGAGLLGKIASSIGIGTGIKQVLGKVAGGAIGGATIGLATNLIVRDPQKKINVGDTIKQGTAFGLNPIGAVAGNIINVAQEHPLATGAVVGTVAGATATYIGSKLGNEPDSKQSSIPQQISAFPTMEGSGNTFNFYTAPQQPTAPVQNEIVPINPINSVVNPQPTTTTEKVPSAKKTKKKKAKSIKRAKPKKKRKRRKKKKN